MKRCRQPLKFICASTPITTTFAAFFILCVDAYEKLKPETAVISCSQEVGTLSTGRRRLERNLFPHRSAEIALEEIGAKIVTTDGSYEKDNATGDRHPGSVVIVVPPGKKPWTRKLDDDRDSVPVPPEHA